MNALIIEDEDIASKRLSQLIKEVAPNINIIAIIASVEASIKWFENNKMPDLIFLDIQLNDGYGFDILDVIKKHPPIIFTTAYNEYAVRGFKYNGLDYLLKPIDKRELGNAINKFNDSPYNSYAEEVPKIENLKALFTKTYKHRFIVRVGNHLSTFNVSDIAYFTSQDGVICLCTHTGKQFPIEYTIDQLETILNPIEFFRINRRYLVNINCIYEIHNYFNSRLALKIKPDASEQIIVSRERCTSFKKWLDM